MSMDEDDRQRSGAEVSSSTDEADAEDPYAWAKSMKNVQEEVGLGLLSFKHCIMQLHTVSSTHYHAAAAHV